MTNSVTPKGTAIQVERWMKQARHDLSVAQKNLDIKVRNVQLIRVFNCHFEERSLRREISA